MSEERGRIGRALDLIEGVIEFGERLWSLLVVGGLLTGALVLYLIGS